MKILRLLNKYYLSILLIFFLNIINGTANEPVDIWNLENKEDTQNKFLLKKKVEDEIPQNSIYEMQSEKKKSINIKEDETLSDEKIQIVGLYDPAENGLGIDMWANSDGKKILDLFERINKINLSDDATEILNIVFLTNAYFPKKNITEKQFHKLKSDWLIKISNFKIIEEYLLKNQIINEYPELTTHLVNEYLSRSETDKACDFFSRIKKNILDEYLSKFNIYCLINNNKIEEAQLLLDLKKELGFKDKFYEKRINYLMGYESSPQKEISEKTILEFHLSHRTNPDFKFDPNNSTSELIWKYLSTSNLLFDIQDVELTDLSKISSIEKATHEENYTEVELFELYKRFQFNINQLLNVKQSSKVLPNTEARALIYQGILITDKLEKKIELIKILKDSFMEDDIGGAFKKELKFFLKEMDIEKIPANYSEFYDQFVLADKVVSKNIKINNKVLHQSKLINYFLDKSKIKNIEKELNNFLKRIKKDKKYFLSLKDIILVEALKSDGIKVSKKYKNLYQVDNSEMPSDIQYLIDNKDMGLAMLRIVEVIGQDKLETIDPETMFFIISLFNQLDIDPIRNRILIKVLPLKV